MGPLKWGIIRRRVIPYSGSDFIAYKALSRLVSLSLPDIQEVGMMKLGLREDRKKPPGLQLQIVALGMWTSK